MVIIFKSLILGQLSQKLIRTTQFKENRLIPRAMKNTVYYCQFVLFVFCVIR